MKEILYDGKKKQNNTKTNFLLQNKKHIKFNLSVYFADTKAHIHMQKHIFRFYCTLIENVDTHTHTHKCILKPSVSHSNERLEISN